jgi:hypothetical protein
MKSPCSIVPFTMGGLWISPLQGPQATPTTCRGTIHRALPWIVFFIPVELFLRINTDINSQYRFLLYMYMKDFSWEIDFLRDTICSSLHTQPLACASKMLGSCILEMALVLPPTFMVPKVLSPSFVFSYLYGYLFLLMVSTLQSSIQE